MDRLGEGVEAGELLHGVGGEATHAAAAEAPGWSSHTEDSHGNAEPPRAARRVLTWMVAVGLATGVPSRPEPPGASRKVPSSGTAKGKRPRVLTHAALLDHGVERLLGVRLLEVLDRRPKLGIRIRDKD